jgi:ABC-2 type transport system permease protein
VRRAGWFGSSLDLGISLGSIEPSLLAWFVIFFILGFFFYASIYAAGGAVVSRVEEVNQVVTIVTMLIAAGFIAAFMSFTNPNGRLAVITSLIPFTSPMVMFARLTLGNPAPSQVAASVLLLILAVAGGAWFSGRVYRIGVLLYGKRPTLREIVRYLRA